MSDQVTALKFFVPGHPEPAGSKKSYVPLDKKKISPEWPRGMPYQDANGRVIVNTIDDNSESKIWKGVVSTYATFARGPLQPTDGPVALDLVFVVTRPKKHYRTGKFASLLRDDAPLWPAVKPDVLKLARGVEDALTGIIWVDDARIIPERIAKTYGSLPGVHVSIRPCVELDLSWIYECMSTPCK